MSDVYDVYDGVEGFSGSVGCTIHKKTCPVCGEVFYANGEEWAWKVSMKVGREAQRPHCVCSYSCMRKIEKENAEKARKSRENSERNRAAAESRRSQEAKDQRAANRDSFHLHVDFHRPDIDKTTGERLTLGKVKSLLVQNKICIDANSAETFLRRKVPDEGWYQTKIMDSLKDWAKKRNIGCKIWKAQQGNYSQAGVSDIIGVIGGVPIAIEVKRPLFGNASAHQVKFIEDITAAGGIAGFAVYPEDLEPIYSEIERRLK